MTNALKVAIAAAAVVVVVVAGINFLPRSGAGIGGPGAGSPSPVVSLSPEPSPSHHADRMTVAGSAEAGSTLHLTVQLPEGWANNDMAASRDPTPPGGVGFRVTLVDNTFKDPCSHVQRSPKVGSTVEALTTALGEVPDTRATEPVQTHIAGHEATYMELTTQASLPCEPDQFYLWQDSPSGHWWLNGPDQVIQVWILEVGGQRVTISALTYPGTTEQAKSELQVILDSIVFDSPS
jgi:hypothetical protein